MRKGFFMSKILITGNGFDLFHHLPTKYHHFISIMKTIEHIEYESTIVSFEELFGRIFMKSHQNEYDLIKENYNTENIKFNNEKLSRIKQLLETNVWYKYFKTVLEIETWIDFEMEIEYILNQFLIFNKYTDKSVVKRNFHKDELMYQTDFNQFDVVNFLENFKFKLNSKYVNTRKGIIDVKLILDDLAKSFEDFIIIFNYYLVDIVSFFYTEIKQESIIPFHLMDKIYTFNYTPTLEKMYKVDKSKVVYLHGEINEDFQKQNLVLGVSDILNELKKFKSYGFTKYYQKINKNANNRFIEIPSETSAYNEETFFYIIGHSLDISDKEYILDLFKFLEVDRVNKSKICVFYYDDYDKESKIKNLLSIVGERIISRMHSENRLCFVELNNDNIEKEFKRTFYKHNVVC